MGAIGAIRKKIFKKNGAHRDGRDGRDRRAGEISIGAPILCAYRAQHIPGLSYAKILPPTLQLTADY